MSGHDAPIRTWHDPSPAAVGKDPLEFLRRLEMPTWLTFPGRSTQPRRVLSTLLHGNEPSGVRALHRWIKEGAPRQCALAVSVASVQAALASPAFTHRMLPGARDLNRCFRQPYADAEGRVASALLALIDDYAPEAMIDVHNTSGSSPSFAVMTRDTAVHKALASMYTPRMVITGLRLGALMETERSFPIVTAECGGAQDDFADEVAYQGLMAFANRRDIAEPRYAASELAVYRHPMRLELRTGARIAYASAPAADAALTLRPDAERLNFSELGKGDPLGWLGPEGLRALRLRDAIDTDRLAECFDARDGQLVARMNLHLFMLTPETTIASSDCICYVTPA